MINIIGNDDYTIFYECDCGTRGKCIFRPLDSSSAVVVNVKCAICGNSVRVVLIQQEEKAKSVNSPEDIEYGAAFVIKNIIM